MLRIKKVVKNYLIKKMIRTYRRDKLEFLKPLLKLITSRWLLKRKFIDLKEYKKINTECVQYLLKRNITLNYSDVKFYPSNSVTPLIEIRGDKYAVKLILVSIIGGSNLVIFDNKYVLYDLKSQDTTKNFDYSDEAILYRKEEDIVIPASFSKETLHAGIFIGGNYSSNYYHLLYEVMVKFEYLSELNIDKKIPLLVDEICLAVPQYHELLNYLNVDNREIVPIAKGEICLVEQLFYFPSPNIIPPNYVNLQKVRSSSILFSPESIFFLKQKLLPFKSNTKKFSKKIFISRKNASARRQYNENEVLEVVKKYGFFVYHPENYSVSEQIELFNEAEFIVGATGAAFSNILFCNDKCKVICLTNYKINLSVFSTIAKLNNINLTYLFDDSLNLNLHSDLHQSFKVNLSALERLLSNVNL